MKFAGICIIAFSMPSIESFKWNGFGLFLFGVIGQMFFQSRIKWRRPISLEYFFILILGVALMSALANWPIPSGITGLKDTFFYLLIGWLVSISPFSDKQIKIFLYFLIAGALLGLILGAIEFFSNRNPFLEFNSIPNLNRSVIYLLITIFTMYGMLIDNSGIFSIKAKILISTALSFSLGGLLFMGSRAGLIAFITGTALFFISFFNHRKIRFFFILGLIILLALLSGLSKYMTMPAVKSRLDKFIHYYQVVINDSPAENSDVSVSNRTRIDYLRVAWAQITQKGHLLLGLGPATFKYIKIEELDITPPLMEYKKSWHKLSHAHNEYLNRLVEQGVLGLGVHLAFLIYLGICLFRHRPQKGRIHWLWVACLGIFNTAVVAGAFNTVFTNEIAWQAMMLIGFFTQGQHNNQ